MEEADEALNLPSHRATSPRSSQLAELASAAATRTPKCSLRSPQVQPGGLQEGRLATSLITTTTLASRAKLASTATTCSTRRHRPKALLKKSHPSPSTACLPAPSSLRSTYLRSDSQARTPGGARSQLLTASQASTKPRQASPRCCRASLRRPSLRRSPARSTSGTYQQPYSGNPPRSEKERFSN